MPGPAGCLDALKCVDFYFTVSQVSHLTSRSNCALPICNRIISIFLSKLLSLLFVTVTKNVFVHAATEEIFLQSIYIQYAFICIPFKYLHACVCDSTGNAF